MLRHLFMVVLLVLCCSTATIAGVISKVQSGQAVKIGVLGNSIGCGQTATGFNTGTMLNSTYANAITGASAHNMLTSFGPHDPVEGWVNQLYAWLLTKNASNTEPLAKVLNLSSKRDRAVVIPTERSFTQAF